MAAEEAGGPAADRALEERLRAAGLIEQLSLLRWGSHPYLPRVSFNPHAQALGEERIAGLDSRMKEKLRTRGHAEYESAVDEQLRAAKEQHPGKLSVQVQMGKAKAPTDGRCQALLDVAARIAQINAEANPPV